MKPINNIFTLLGILTVCVLACNSKAIEYHNNLGHEASLIYVIDGDTQIFRIGNDKIRVRHLHINCPEMTSYLGLEAKEFVINLKMNKVKLLHDNKFDKYGRLLAEIELPDGRILNQMLVKEGLATHYKKYSNSEIYNMLEIAAKTQKIGLWEK